MSERETMEYDGGGLSFAIRFKQLKPDVSACVIEKASTIGAQILSGEVIELQPLGADVSPASLRWTASTTRTLGH